MVAVPVRPVVAVFAATLIVTVPLPLPLAPLEIVSQAALLLAVQAQLLGVVTLTVLDSPVATALPEAGLIA